MSSKDKKENENENENESENEDENENENENKDENEDENENDDIIKILIHSNEYDEETINQNKKNKIVKKINDHLDETIDKSKSFKEQIKSLKDLNDYYHYKVNDFGDKELKFKIFKLSLAHLSNEIDENLFEQIFDHKFETLANKLVNTTNKEENQIIVDSIKKNKYKLYEKDKYDDFLIQSQQRANLAQVINFILDFNEEFNYENENEDNENENGNKHENKDNENTHENENEENEKLRKEYENEKPQKN